MFKLTPVCLFYYYCCYRAKVYLKGAEDWQNPAESSGSPPDEQRMNAKRDWLGGQYDVCLFVPFFLPVHSAGSKLTVQCAWMSKSHDRWKMGLKVQSCIMVKG